MDVKKWLTPYPIECQCGHAGLSDQKRKKRCVTMCMGNFKATDYPLGYFWHVAKLRGRINTCPPCETEVLRVYLALSKNDRIRRDKVQADIMLLEEWKLTMPDQKKRVRRLYGDDVLRVMQEYANEPDRTKAKLIITEQICIAMSDFPPPRFQHKRLVEALYHFSLI